MFNVLEYQIAKKRRLSRAAFADTVDMLPPIGTKEAKGDHLAPGLPVTDEIHRLAVVIHVKVIARHARASPRSTERCFSRSGDLAITAEHAWRQTLRLTSRQGNRGLIGNRNSPQRSSRVSASSFSISRNAISTGIDLKISDASRRRDTDRLAAGVISEDEIVARFAQLSSSVERLYRIRPAA
jgi:hypothetical protein